MVVDDTVPNDVWSCERCRFCRYFLNVFSNECQTYTDYECDCNIEYVCIVYLRIQILYVSLVHMFDISHRIRDSILVRSGGVFSNFLCQTEILKVIRIFGCECLETRHLYLYVYIYRSIHRFTHAVRWYCHLSTCQFLHGSRKEAKSSIVGGLNLRYELEIIHWLKLLTIAEGRFWRCNC